MKFWPLLSACATLLTATAHAQDWGNIATISSTMGSTANRICTGEGIREGEIGCATYAPTVSTSGILNTVGISTSSNQASFTTVYASGNVGIGTTVPSATFAVNGSVRIGDNQRLFWSNNAYNSGNMYLSASGTTMKLYEYSDPTLVFSTISGDGLRIKNFELAFPGSGSLKFGSGSAYQNYNGTNGLRLQTYNSYVDFFNNAPGGGSMVRFDMGYGKYGFGTATPTTVMHVSGTIRMSDSGEACDANRAGAIKWNGTQFQVCYGTGGWALLSSADVSGTIGAPDRIVSGTAQIIARNNAGVSITADTDVSGSLRLSGTITVAGTAADICTPERHGTIRRNPVTGSMQICH